MDFTKSVLQAGFEPLGDSYAWNPQILWSNAMGDGVIALSFFIISAGLIYFVHKRQIVRTRPIFVLFAAFIMLCGISHVLEIVSIWHPVYWLQSMVKVSTGVIALSAALVLMYHLPEVLSLPSAGQLAGANQELKLKTDKLASQNEFLRNLAYATYHDLREPIRGMAINAQMLLLKHQDRMNDEMREETTHILRESKRMFSSVDAILKLTFLESEKYKFEPVSLTEVMLKTENRLQQQMKANDVTIHYQNLPLVYGNENLLCILFENVIANSIYFRSAKAPQIAISASEEGENYKIVIRDNGVGFSNEYRHQIFEMFKTLGNSLVYRGPGLGLAMSKRIAAIHGGDITADSKEGDGTAITIKLSKAGATVNTNVEQSLAA